jgi:hypothetical protein
MSNSQNIHRRIVYAEEDAVNVRSATVEHHPKVDFKVGRLVGFGPTICLLTQSANGGPDPGSLPGRCGC